jgi:imidazolonepropionase-like amidohydrolase
MNQSHQQGTTSFLRRMTWLSCAMLFGSVGVAGQVTVLGHVTVIDGNGGAPRHDATVVIDGAKIRSVTSGPSRIPAGAKTIDLTGRTIMPELVNAHGHLGLLHGTKTSAANYSEENVKRQLLQYQEYGVGAVLVMGTDRDEAYGWRAQSHAGTLPGALLYTAGRGFGVSQAMPPAAMGADEIYRPTAPEEARRDVRELAQHHPDVVKMWVDDFYGQYRR